MKILIIMGGFFPGKKYGGPPVSVDNFCKLMKEDECYVVTHNHDMGESEKYKDIAEGWNNRANYKVLYLDDKEYCYKTFERITDEIKPDVIYLQGLFQSCILPCLIIAKKKNIKVILASRGELCVGAFKKRYKKIPYIVALKIFGLLKNVSFQSTSDEETERIHKLLGIPFERIHELSNVPSIPESKFDITEKKSGQAKFIFLSRIHPKKNLFAAIQYLRDITGDVLFDIYGSLEDAEYWKKCQQEIETLPKNVKVNYCGLLSHEQVHETFSQYNGFIFPTYSENFGHVIAEALSVGCPVIISDQTPWTDVNKYNAGGAFVLNNNDAFIEYIQNVVDMDEEEYGILSNNAKQYFEKKMQLEQLKKKYKTALEIVRGNKCI